MFKRSSDSSAANNANATDTPALRTIPFQETEAYKQLLENPSTRNLKITPWEETAAGKEFSATLEAQRKDFENMVKEIATLPKREIDVSILNSPKYERPSGSGCYVETVLIEPYPKVSLFQPKILYNDNLGNNHDKTTPMFGSTSES